uniref:Ovule protein n=1 Tax=Steinernema glaseri TaxID=37863 RepID=A0A1I8ATC0_9BILA
MREVGTAHPKTTHIRTTHTIDKSYQISCLIEDFPRLYRVKHAFSNCFGPTLPSDISITLFSVHDSQRP